MANNVNNGITGVIDIPGALRSRGAADGDLVGGVVAYAGDIYDTTLEKNLAEVNSDFTEAIDDVNDSISSIQDDISPLTGSFSLQQLAEYDGLEVYEGGRGKHNRVYIDDKNLAMNFGYNNSVSNTRKLAFGFGQQLDVPDSTFVIGQRNSYEPNAAFIVGNGTLDGSTNNAFVIGRDGNFWVYGINGYAGQLTGANQYNSVNNFITSLNTRLTSLEGVTSSLSSAPTYSAGTGISISNNTISVDATQLSYDDLTDTPLTKNENEYGYSLGAGNHAEDFDSFAGGNGSKAKGEGSLSFGWESVAKGYYSLAFGGGANATSMYSHAEGLATNATGYESHAEGNGSMIETRTTLPYTSGDQYLYVETSVPVGSCIRYIQQGQSLYGIPAVTVTACVEDNGSYRLTLPSGGIDKSISNQGSVSISGAAYGVASHAEGQGTLAKGRASHAEGMNTLALNDCEHAEGKFNVSHSNTISSIGVGSASNDRKNAFEVTNNGDIYVKGLGSYDGTSISNVSTLLNVITGINTRVATLENSSSSSSSSYITYSEGEGYSLGDTATASGENSFAEGDSTTASGVTSHAEGYSTTASGQGSHAEGGFSTASGDYSHAEGDSNTASGRHSHAEGCNTTASAQGAHTEGVNTIATGNYSHAEGNSTETTNVAEHAEGSYNLSTSNVTKSSIGIGTAGNARKNAVEVTIDGSVYIKGIGNYNGTNITGNNVKSVQQVITELTLQIAALTNNL